MNHSFFASAGYLSSVGLLAALTFLPSSAHASQSVLVENFDDGNLVTTTWGNAEWYGTTNTTALTNRGLALRAANNGGGFSAPLFPSDKATSLTVNGSGLAFRYGNAGINAASNSTIAERNHQTVLSLTRTTPANLNQTPYLRFTAWRDPLVAAPGTGSRFVAIVTSPDVQAPTANPYGANTFAPVSGGVATGVAITTVPKVFQLKLDDPAVAGQDSVYTANVRLFGMNQVAANLANVVRFGFGYYRTGADAGTAMDPVAFFLDDIILSSNPAGYVTTATLTTIDEQNSPTQATVEVALSAMPSHDVVLNVASSDTNALTVSPSSLTFTQANWNVPQTVTVTSVNDSIANGNRNASVQFSKGATADLLYADSSVTVPADVTFTVLPVSLREMSVE